MMKLIIIDKNNKLYTLKDINNKIHKLQFDFKDIKEIPNIGDTITISEKLLDKTNEEYSAFYTFGPLDNTNKTEEKDKLTIITNSNIIVLKRLYG